MVHPSAERLPATRFQGRCRQRRGRQRVTVVPADLAEAFVTGGPAGPESDDLFVTTPDEVPPHDDLFLERHAAKQEKPARTVRPQRQVGAAGAEVQQWAGGELDTVDIDDTDRVSTACSNSDRRGNWVPAPAANTASAPTSGLYTWAADVAPSSEPMITVTETPVSVSRGRSAWCSNCGSTCR